VPIQECEAPFRASGAAASSQLIWLRAIVKWKKLESITAIAVVGVGLAAALLLPSRYTATVVIMPPQSGTASSPSAMMAQLSGVGALA
jgi:uncharacterized protein involved in exopolysaccharide biosynthesis